MLQIFSLNSLTALLFAYFVYSSLRNVGIIPTRLHDTDVIAQPAFDNFSLKFYSTDSLENLGTLEHDLTIGENFKNVKFDLESESKFIHVVAQKGGDVFSRLAIERGRPDLVINIINEPIALATTPQCVLSYFEMSADRALYAPLVYHNKFFDTSKFEHSLKTTVHVSRISLLKLRWFVQFTAALDQQTATFGSEIDDIRRMFFDTNFYLLILTFAVSLLHSLFDFLAFKSDVQFWRNKTNCAGISLRSLTINAISQLIVLLYLFDKRSSWILLLSSSVGLGIELWKIFRARNSVGYTETKEYDDLAMRYMGYLSIPCIVGYMIYAYKYASYTNLYSFIIETMVGFVYAFGFFMMLPQLFINYKLKSVAHLPWKSFVYKALNTFVDDLFAFVVKMPLLHRIACFRDDVLFIVFLYQMWIYPTDKTRVNEFGQSEEPATVKNKSD